MHYKTLCLLAVLGLATAPAQPQTSVLIGLITKTDTNPFFVKMKEGAKAEARKLDARLLVAAGTQDGDTASQIAAIQRMALAGVKTILIASNGDAVIPAIKKVQASGVQVIALDSPIDGADALFATDNYQAGVLIGQYAKVALGATPARIATLDLFPGHPVGAQRHNGFMRGFGLPAPDAVSLELGTDKAVVCQADSFGDAAKGQAAMENCLKKHPDINVVYTINEPAAAGAHTALVTAGKAQGVLVVSVDGGCSGVADVAQGHIAATSQQYPLRMAAKGVSAGVEYARTGRRTTGYVDTGVNLITRTAVAGIESKDVAAGTQLCWGKK
ncbi:substrate-binding domain-containing protein [Rhodoferax saidenbachensis]|uniref:Fructose transport system substrate-binding protein n=1 Tax=Rhodoferax saidenbachensis TaxID=1484693 RepID=A0ABU1ZN12_9BURK|nr:substrate-binding domain-containing protein [Rhodoferax saidenbachensis]MDR7306936.1 fructose transport system substrate-binding protein [Rhodoferax saidenbachensis]